MIDVTRDNTDTTVLLAIAFVSTAVRNCIVPLHTTPKPTPSVLKVVLLAYTAHHVSACRYVLWASTLSDGEQLMTRPMMMLHRLRFSAGIHQGFMSQCISTVFLFMPGLCNISNVAYVQAAVPCSAANQST